MVPRFVRDMVDRIDDLNARANDKATPLEQSLVLLAMSNMNRAGTMMIMDGFRPLLLSSSVDLSVVWS